MSDNKGLSQDSSQEIKKTSFYDKRSYLKRLKISVLPLLAFVFTLFFYGPLDIAISNSSEFVFGFWDVASIMGLFGILLALFLILVVPLARRRLLNNIILFFSGLTLAMYIQCYLMNYGTVKELTGDKNEIPLYILIINAVLWIIIMAIPYIACKISKRCIRPLIRVVPIVIILLQMFGLTVTTAEKISSEGFHKFISSENQKYYLSKKDIYSFSADKNVVVILLDRFDYDYILSVQKKNPTFFDRLDGFTCYTNSTSEFSRTLPGANHLLTANEEGAFLMSVDDFLDSSWTAANGSSIISRLSSDGYKVDIYADISNLMSQQNSLKEEISNIDDKELQIDPFLLISRMSSLSAYRYAPAVLKDVFSVYSVNNITLDNERYIEDDSDFYQELLSQHISLYENGGNNKSFKFYHLHGPHAPYKLNADGSSSSVPTNVTEQTMGVFSILYELFDEMKALGIYENASIIITTDHGDDVNASKELSKATCTGLFYKPSGACGNKLVYSDTAVSQKNIPSTILKEAGSENYSDYGKPIDELTDNDNTVRYHYKGIVEGTSEKYVCKYEITGDAKVFENWKLVERFDVSEQWKN